MTYQPSTKVLITSNLQNSLSTVCQVNLLKLSVYFLCNHICKKLLIVIGSLCAYLS